MIVPFPPGGSSDIVMRLVASKVSESIRQPIVIDNRPGGAGNVAAMAIKNAAPDGYTLMMGSIGTFGSQPLLYKLDFDPIKAFAPVATVVIDKSVLVVGPSLPVPYAVVLHGAEVTLPGRLPGGRMALAHVIRQADRVIAAGQYPATEAARATGTNRMPPTSVIPPGVDTDRFRPLDDEERHKARADLGLPVDGDLVVSVSRLVPRKGMDVLIDAAANTRSRATLAIAGAGRDRQRLENRARSRGGEGNVRFLGKVPDDDLPKP